MVKNTQTQNYAAPNMEVLGLYYFRRALCASTYELPDVEEDDTIISWLDD